jgi:hypothetical protein
MTLFRSFALLAAVGALLAGSVGSAPASAAAQDLPDLSIANYGCCWTIRPSTTGEFWLTVQNPPGVRKVFDPERRTYVPELYNVPASNVTVRAQLPAGWTYVSARGDHGFTCGAAGGVVTCSGGTINGDDQAYIIVSVTAPAGPLYVQQPVQATVDPNNAIAERIETNNTGRALLMVGEPIG